MLETEIDQLDDTATFHVRLHQALVKAGIPIHGVSGEQESLRIDFHDEATAEQKSQAEGIVNAFDWRPRIQRRREELEADLSNLSEQQVRKLLIRLLCERIESDPYWADQQGVEVPGDEPV